MVAALARTPTRFSGTAEAPKRSGGDRPDPADGRTSSPHACWSGPDRAGLRSPLAALVTHQNSRSHRLDQWLAAAVPGCGRAGHRSFTGPERRRQRSAQTDQLPRGLCPDAPATECRASVVGPLGGGLAGRISAEQPAGITPAVCPHRGIGSLGRSQLGGGGHHPHLRATGQSQSPGGVPGANPAHCRRGNDSLAWLGGQALRSHSSDPRLRFNAVQL